MVQAGAGSGKTLTLRAMARAARRPGMYLAFNKAIATQAQRDFPPTTTESPWVEERLLIQQGDWSHVRSP